MDLSSLSCAVLTMTLLASGQTGIWEERVDRDAKRVLTHVTYDPADGQTWFALVEGSVWVSYKSGDGWRYAGNPGKSASALTFAPEIGPGLYARTSRDQVHRSSDDGATWELQADLHMAFIDGRWTVRRGDPWKPPGGATAFAVDPSNPDIIYAATNNGVYASSDGGSNWEERNAWLEDRKVRAIRVDPSNTQTLLAVCATNTYHSTNGGRMWSKAPAEDVAPGHWRDGHLYQLLKVDGERIFTRTGEGKIAVANRESWSKYDVTCKAFSVLPNGDVVCANAGKASVGSVDGARFDRKLDMGFGMADVRRLSETADGNIAASLNGGGLLVSADIMDWSAMFTKGDIYAAAKDPQGSGVWFAAAKGGIHMKKSPAEDWDRRVKDVTATSIMFDPGSPTTVLASTAEGKVLRSDDMGWSFSQVSQGLPAGFIVDMVADPSGSGSLWVGYASDGVYRSRDAGQTWQRVGGDSSPARIRRLAIDPMNPETLWTASRGLGVYRSQDGGDSWAPIETGCPHVFDVTVHPFQSEKVAVGCVDGVVMVTEDGGSNWARSPLEFEGDATAVLYTEQHDNALVVGTDRAAIVMATGSGDVVTSDRFANMLVKLTAWSDDGRIGVIYGPEGMFRTKNRGEDWEGIGWTKNEVSSVDISEDGSRIWAYSPGQGLYLKEGDGRWDDQPMPKVRIDECTLKMNVDHRAWVKVKGSTMLIVERRNNGGLREWYKEYGSWDGRGGMSCTRGDTTYSNLFPSARDEHWKDMAGRFGLFVPEKVNRFANKAGWEVWINAPISGDRYLIMTKDGAIGVLDGKEVIETGHLPAEEIYITKGSNPVIVVCTDRGLRYSRDLGTTWEDM